MNKLFLWGFGVLGQVHGASADAIDYVTQTFLTEVNSVSDNPNIFSEADKIISAGNFHGQPLAISLDFLAIALAELGSISERRTYQLISGARDLPNYLVADPGINSGLMIPQYTAQNSQAMLSIHFIFFSNRCHSTAKLLKTNRLISFLECFINLWVLINEGKYVF